MKKLIAIDGNSLMFRAYYALPNMTASDGTPTGAVFGFINMLMRLAMPENGDAPSHIAVAFDVKQPTFRHIMYDAYKAGRRETPNELLVQFPIIKQLLTDMGIKVIECPGFEADDILGTMAKRAGAEGIDTLIVTGDRDALQLIDGNVHVLLTKKGITETEEYDEAALYERYGLTPDKMPELKALMGDSSDNIPGIKGIGEKTALSLLNKYGSLDAVLSSADSEKGALKTKIETGGESARMSLELGTIMTDAPVETTVGDCAFAPETVEGGREYMTRLELRSIVNRLPRTKSTPVNKPAETAVTTVDIGSAEAVSSMLEANSGKRELAVCSDADSMLLCFGGDTQYRLRQTGTLLDMGLTSADAARAIATAGKTAETVVFDSKALRHMLSSEGESIDNCVFDLMLGDYLLHATHPADSVKTLLAERGYSSVNAPALLAVRDNMKRELAEKGMTSLYEDIELPLSRVLFDMEREGFAVDTEALRELGISFALEMAQLESSIYDEAGHEFNILSPKQLGAVLFDELGLPAKKKTKTGYSTDADTLESISSMHPIVERVVRYRFLTKLKSTFIDALIQKTDRSGRVHTSFNQNVTATGRISSTEPNLQNIPVRTELGREIRKAFVASPGNVLVAADYSQIELRLLAHVSGDAGLIASFVSGEDIHRRTASEVFGVAPELVTKEMRSAAKAVNFGIIYGISDFGLAKNIGTARKTAAEYIERYLARYPGVKRYMEKTVEDARKQKYAVTMMGRRRELADIASSNFNTRSFAERVALNMPIQGAAADIIKLAMVNVAKELKAAGLSAKLILQIHDELIIDAPEAEAEQAAAILRSCMENVVKLSVPLTADVGTGHSWFDAKA